MTMAIKISRPIDDAMPDKLLGVYRMGLPAPEVTIDRGEEKTIYVYKDQDFVLREIIK